MARKTSAARGRGTGKIYAVYDAHGRRLSTGMSYKAAHKAKRAIEDMSRTGMLQAIVATYPFHVKQV